MGLIDRIKGAFTRMAADTGLSKKFRDIFEVGGVPAFNQFYYYGIFIWHYLYKGLYKPWHIVPAPTINDPRAKRELFRFNMAKAACAELASMLWAEKCNVKVNLPGFEPTEEEPEDKAQRFISRVLDRNAFGVKMQEAIEQMLALGGEALKVWYEQRYDRDGNPIPDSGEIKIGYCMADQFVPTAWNNAEVTEGVFISRQAKDGYYYTRLEWHKWNGTTYVISNELYRAEQKSGNEPQDILGFRYPLNTLYPMLDEETPIQGLEKSLFSYMRTPVANNLDDNSPLGVSVYGNALETLHALDICYDSFVREFELGKKRIIVPARAIRTVVDPETKAPRRYFDANDSVYEALATDDISDLKIIDNSVELRIEEHIAAMNALLQILCLQVGFSGSTFSFDAHGGLKTATEVISENSKTYKTVKSCQNAVEPAIKQLIHNIFAIAMLYDVKFEGESVSSWFKDGMSLDQQYELDIYWDDGVVQDRTTQINEGILLLGNGVISKRTFQVDYLGLSEAEADQEAERIAVENQVDVPSIDMLGAIGEGAEPITTSGGRALSGAQTQSVITAITRYQDGEITIGQAMNILSLATGISREEARKIIEGAS